MVRSPWSLFLGLFKTPLLAGLPEPVQLGLAKDIPFPQKLGNPDEYIHPLGTGNHREPNDEWRSDTIGWCPQDETLNTMK